MAQEIKIPEGKVLLVKLMEWERKTGNRFMTLLLTPAKVSLSDMVSLAEMVAGVKPNSPKEAFDIYTQIIAQIAGAEEEAVGALSEEERKALELISGPEGAPLNGK